MKNKSENIKYIFQKSSYYLETCAPASSCQRIWFKPLSLFVCVKTLVLNLSQTVFFFPSSVSKPFLLSFTWV